MSSSAEELSALLGADNPALYDIQTSARGPTGELPLTDEMLRTWSSGDLFGLSQAAGMGWTPQELLGPQFLILSTQGGVRAPDGTPIALGYHTGHWEVGLLMKAAAEELRRLRTQPFSRFFTHPRGGRPPGPHRLHDRPPASHHAPPGTSPLIR